jgi:hypothetical protein
MQHLDAALTLLRTFPEAAPVFRGRYRRLLVPRFPYGIFYSIESGRIILYSVLYLPNDPQTILRRLGA